MWSGYALSRLDYAVNAALLLGFAAQRNGDRIGLLAFDDRVSRFLTPRPGRRQFLALTEALYNLEATATEPDYEVAFTYLASRHRRRSLIVLFTDVTEPEAASALVSHLGRVARYHLAMVVTLRDPEIERLAGLPAVDSESVYRRAIGRLVLDDRDQVLTGLRQRGVLTVDVAADQISTAVINRYLEVKARSAL
jgi:uncharacterized protein (DUF58 family)